MRYNFYANFADITRDEVLSVVDPQILKYIKNSNKSPLLKAYIVAHEGVATPSVQGEAVMIQFTRDGVSKVYAKMETGKPVYMDHADGENRKVYATVVGKGLTEIDGKLSAVAVLYFDRDQEQFGIDHNYVSMEVEFMPDKNGNINDVVSFDGIALVPKDKKPALDNARAVATLKATKLTKGYFDMSETLDWHQLEAEFRKRRGLASQISDPTEMIGDITFDEHGNPILTGMDKKYTSHVADLFKKALEKKSQPYSKMLEKLKSENAELRKKATLLDIKPQLLDMAKQAKLGKEFESFIEKRIDRFKPTDDIEESMREFIEDKKIDYRELTKDRKSIGVGGNDPEPDEEEVIDYNDPKNNPLL
jgi:hypothetical protein